MSRRVWSCSAARWMTSTAMARTVRGGMPSKRAVMPYAPQPPSRIASPNTGKPIRQGDARRSMSDAPLICQAKRSVFPIVQIRTIPDFATACVSARRRIRQRILRYAMIPYFAVCTALRSAQITATTGGSAFSRSRVPPAARTGAIHPGNVSARANARGGATRTAPANATYHAPTDATRREACAAWRTARTAATHPAAACAPKAAPTDVTRAAKRAAPTSARTAAISTTRARVQATASLDATRAAPVYAVPDAPTAAMKTATASAPKGARTAVMQTEKRAHARRDARTDATRAAPHAPARQAASPDHPATRLPEDALASRDASMDATKPATVTMPARPSNA